MLMLVLAMFASLAVGSLPIQHNATTQAIPAVGAIQGNLHDTNGGALPGATITVAQGNLRRTVVTDTAGSYKFSALPVGSYTVTAALMGFNTGVRSNVIVPSAGTTRVDFVLCTASLEDIDWIAPRDLSALWTRADVVARIQISGTRPVQSDCAWSGFEHTAAVRDLLKDASGRVNGHTLTFVQENWSGERTPYAGDQEMIVFLAVTPRGLYRVAGPQSAFLIAGNQVVGARQYLGATGSMTVTEFLASLRGLGKVGD